MLYKYLLFGIPIESEIYLPEIPETNEDALVMIRYGKVDDNLQTIYTKGVCFEVGKSTFLLKINSIAKYLVKDGNTIIIEKYKDTTEKNIRLFLLSSALTALMQQRKEFPLHGNTIEINNEAVIFCGNSGTGKSTLSAAFLRKNFSFVSDDLSIVKFNNEGNPMVLSGLPRLKLWNDSLLHLGETVDDKEQVREGIQKYFFPVTSHLIKQPIPLKKIYILGSNLTNIELYPILGTDKFNAIKNNTCRLRYIGDPELKKEHFNFCSTLSNKVSIARLTRSKDSFNTDEMIEKVLIDLKAIK